MTLGTERFRSRRRPRIASMVPPPARKALTSSFHGSMARNPAAAAASIFVISGAGRIVLVLRQGVRLGIGFSRAEGIGQRAKGDRTPGPSSPPLPFALCGPKPLLRQGAGIHG